MIAYDDFVSVFVQISRKRKKVLIRSNINDPLSTRYLELQNVLTTMQHVLPVMQNVLRLKTVTVRYGQIPERRHRKT